jgi:L-iditol 2-dehydrogenase
MWAAVLAEPGRIEMEERPVPSPEAGDGQMRVSAVGVCGSDAHDYRHGRVGSFVVDAPLEKAAEALDSDRTRGSVKTVVAVS